MSINRSQLRLGMHVAGSDGDHVGRVKQIRTADFLVDRQFGRDVYIPFEAIERIVLNEHPASLHVGLNVVASRTRKMGWAQPALVGGH